jgi:hypothetical protein
LEILAGLLLLLMLVVLLILMLLLDWLSCGATISLHADFHHVLLLLLVLVLGLNAHCLLRVLAVLDRREGRSCEFPKRGC